MAVELRGVPTYPVWVGDLKETVRENDLSRVFSRFGRIASCKIMLDDRGLSRHFGFVNFYMEVEAERAALKMSGFMIHGSHIKTKGPQALRDGNHFSPPTVKSPQQMQDFRPYTDCLFGPKCGKGIKCPYRHKEETTGILVCPNWLEKKCINVHCAYRHPGGKEGQKVTKDPSPQPPVGASRELFPISDLLKCEGRCGDMSCRAHFESREDLSQHIKLTRKLQCRHCRAIFLNERDHLQHMATCTARLVSTDRSSFSSESADIEVLSDDDSSDEAVNQLYGHQQFGIHKSASAAVFGSSSSPDKQRRDPSRRLSENDSLSATASPVKSKKRQRRPRSRKKGSSTPTPASTSRATLEGYSVGLVYDEFGLPERDEDDLSSDEDDEGDVNFKYSQTEMARLLSLNEQDMYDTSDESGSSGEVSVRGDGGVARTNLDGKNSKKKSRSRKKDNSTSSSNSQSTPNKAHPKTRLEPVGVFWDIENCSVPEDKSAFKLAAKIRRVFFAGKREAEFLTVCDITKERKEVMDSLHKAQVTLVHVNAVAKNAADDKLNQSLRRFAYTYQAPATVVLISSDINFSPTLSDLRYIHNISVVLIHGRYNCSAALKEFANTAIEYETFLEDVDAPSQAQKPILSRIVAVSNLPRGGSATVAKIKNRLDQLSDNCGGKVLWVNKEQGTARVLFRTHDWAVKSMKRMNGERVLGCAIQTALEPPTPYDAGIQLGQLSGQSLSKSFPPKAPTPTGFHSPQMPPRQIQPHPPPRAPLLGSPIRLPPPPQAPPHIHPSQHPVRMRPPYPPQGTSMDAFQPRLPMSPPVYAHPPLMPTPPSQLPKGAIPRPEGRILVFKIPPVPEAHLDQLNGHMVSVRLEASVKASHLILWHSFSELQILLHVEFVQTAQARREEIIHALYERGELKQEIAQKFVEGCVVSIEDVIRRHQLPWEVTTCGWSSDEEEERVVRSKVIALLRQCVPSYWTKWNNFKKRYLDTYSSAISEMTVHSTCKGAVQILGDANNSQSQVIVFYELSPLVKLGSNVQFHSQLKINFVKFLSSQPDKRIKLLDFVREYREANVGPLPVASSGKVLQELLSTIPNITLVGGKPSTIFVTLSSPGTHPQPPVTTTQRNLSGISEAFRNLLLKSPNFELPYSRFQQEYQTFYHHSFRVSDYIPGENTTTKQLLQACEGITLRDIKLANGKKETFVGIAQTALPQRSPTPASRSNTPTAATTRAPKDLSDLCASFHNLLMNSPNCELPLSRFQQEYQTFYHHSFRVSNYLPGANATTKQLLQFCEGITLKEVNLSNGRTETLVGITQTELPQRSPTPAARSNTTIAATTRAPKDLSDLCASFRNLLMKSPNFELPLSRFQQEYQTFYHHSFRVSNYLPSANATTKQLLQFCEGITLKEVNLLNGKTETVVGIAQTELPQRGPTPVTRSTNIPASSTAASTKLAPSTSVASTSVSTSSLPAAEQIPKESIQLFRQECVEVLESFQGEKILLVKFPEAYTKLKLQPFLLARYKAKKLLHLVQAIPDVVQLSGDKDVKCMELIDSIGFCKRRVERLLYSLPNHQIYLDRFMLAYENFHGEKLSHFYGHSKLSKLLETFSDSSVKIEGSGPTRKISLMPLKLFAFEIVDLLTANPSGLPINGVVPTYKEKFGREFVIAKYGVAKLIRALEAITDVIDIRGSGASRTIHLKASPNIMAIKAPLLPTPGPVPLSPPHVLIDEVTALLLSSQSSKMTINTLTKKYNESFRLSNNLPPVESGRLCEALNKLENFKVTAQHVQLVPSVDSPAKQAKSKQNQSSNGAEGVCDGPTSVPSTMSQEIGATSSDCIEMPPLISLSPSNVRDKPKPKKNKSPTSLSGPTLSVKDAERLSSETKRLLLCHREHALTLSELVECFKEAQDPAAPTVEQLYDSLTKFNVKGGAGKTEQKFQILYISSSVGDSIVQLNRPDCLWKLAQDLQYLFIYHPSNSFSIPLSEVESLYEGCYGWRLSPAVYGSPSVELLFDHKVIKSLVKLDHRSHMCTLPETSRQCVLVNLLAELLFLRGEEMTCSAESLPILYQEHFGCDIQLECFGVDTLSGLLLLPKVSDSLRLQVSDDTFQSRLTVTTTSLLAEQIRHLLTVHNGRVPFQDLQSIYTAQFGNQTSIDAVKVIDKRFILTASRVVNFAGDQRWLVWAPAGHPYPAKRRGLDSTAAVVDFGHPTNAYGQTDDLKESLNLPPKFESSPDEAANASRTTSQTVDPYTSLQSDVLVSQASPPFSISSTPQTSNSGDQFSYTASRTHAPLNGNNIGIRSSPLEERFTEWPSFDKDVTVPYVPVNTSKLPLDSSSHKVNVTSSSVPSSTISSEAVVDPSPYGFLEKELGPELMAELISNAHPCDEDAPSTSDSHPDLFDYLDDDLPPKSDPALDEMFEKLVLVSEATAKGEPIPTFERGGQEERKDEEVLVPHKTMDYLEEGMDPEQVLEEFRKVKESAGGILSPALMDPFLTYFGELSGQAIERMQAAEREKKPKKGVAKKKRTIAIRFPGQSTHSDAVPRQPNEDAPEEVSGVSDYSNGQLSTTQTTPPPSLKESTSDTILTKEPKSDRYSQEDSGAVGVASSHVTEIGSALETQLVVVDSSHVAESGSALETQCVEIPASIHETKISSQACSDNTSEQTSAKIASIRDKSIADWRPFVLSAVNYTLNNDAISLDVQTSSTKDDDLEVD